MTFSLFGRAPLARGKVVRLKTEAHGFDFHASYGEADDRQVTAMTFDGAGFEGALDGAIACSRGEKGWWGEGAAAR